MVDSRVVKVIFQIYDRSKPLRFCFTECLWSIIKGERRINQVQPEKKAVPLKVVCRIGEGVGGDEVYIFC